MENKKHGILQELRSNARIPISELSRIKGMPYSTIFDKIKDLEKNVITKYTSILDFRKLGYQLKASILLKANNNHNHLEKYFLGQKNINNISRIGDGYDYLVEVLFKNNNEYNEFLEVLNAKGIEKIKTHFIIEDLSREQAFTKIFTDLKG